MLIWVYGQAEQCMPKVDWVMCIHKQLQMGMYTHLWNRCDNIMLPLYSTEYAQIQRKSFRISVHELPNTTICTHDVYSVYHMIASMNMCGSLDLVPPQSATLIATSDTAWKSTTLEPRERSAALHKALHDEHKSRHENWKKILLALSLPGFFCFWLFIFCVRSFSSIWIWRGDAEQ